MSRPSRGLGRAERVDVKTSLPKETGEAWRAFVAQQGSETASSLLRVLITEFTKRGQADQQAAVDVVDYLIALQSRVPPEAIQRARRMRMDEREEGGPGKRYELKLKASEARGVDAMADAANVSPTHWLVSYVRAGLTGTLLKPHPDMQAMLGVRAELTPIGRNLNQIAKGLNAHPTLVPVAVAKDYTRLAKTIMTALKALEKAQAGALERGRLYFETAAGKYR